MPYSAFQSFPEPHELDAAVRAASLKTVIASSGDYRSEWARIDLEKLWMQHVFTSVPSITHVAVKPGRNVIYFLVDQSEAPVLHDAKQLSSAEIVVISRGGEYHRRTMTQCSWASMSLSPEDVAAAGRALIGRDISAPSVTRIIRPRTDLMVRLQRAHAAARHLARTAPEMLEAPEVAKALEQDLVRKMVACLTSGTDIADHELRHPRFPVMRKLEQILGQNEDRPLYLSEICPAIGVSERTLRTHCLEHLGIGPIRYLWLRRMHLARRALVLAEPTSTTVTSIANDYGFGELGRFAVNYRLLFGESPSATLARHADARRWSARGT